MHDSPGVRCVQCIDDLDAELQHLLGLHRLARDTLLQRLALQQLHDNELLAFVLANVVDGANIGMIQGGGGTGLAPKALQRLGVAGKLLGQELEGDHTAQAHILGLVDHSHAAAAELFQNLVV